MCIVESQRDRVLGMLQDKYGLKEGRRIGDAYRFLSEIDNKDKIEEIRGEDGVNYACEDSDHVLDLMEIDEDRPIRQS